MYCLRKKLKKSPPPQRDYKALYEKKCIDNENLLSEVHKLSEIVNQNQESHTLSDIYDNLIFEENNKIRCKLDKIRKLRQKNQHLRSARHKTEESSESQLDLSEYIEDVIYSQRTITSRSQSSMNLPKFHHDENKENNSLNLGRFTKQKKNFPTVLEETGLTTETRASLHSQLEISTKENSVLILRVGELESELLQKNRIVLQHALDKESNVRKLLAEHDSIVDHNRHEIKRLYVELNRKQQIFDENLRVIGGLKLTEKD
jgi:hypothetical protein